MKLTREEIETCQRTGEMKALTMMYMEMAKLRLIQGTYDDEKVQSDYECLKVLRGKKDEKYFVFCTISPPNNTSVEDLVKCGNKIMKKKWLQERYLLVYEQRGENTAELGKNPHIHLIWIQHGMREASGKATSLQHCLNSIKKTAESMLEGCSLVGRWHDERAKSELGKSIGYLLGEKKNLPKKDKQTAQKFDKIWRKENGLKEYYGTNEFS